jgi:hypothetical protein
MKKVKVKTEMSEMLSSMALKLNSFPGQCASARIALIDGLKMIAINMGMCTSTGKGTTMKVRCP